MEKQIEDQLFEDIDYSGKRISAMEFTNCRFHKCDFSNSFFNNNDFIDVQFKDCNFSMTALENTGIKTVSFVDCKLLGIEFSKCSNFLFDASFVNCQMDYCSFFQKRMKKTFFKKCSLRQVDFTETDLSSAVFEDCDLLNASFMRSVLEKTDFRTAINYMIDPELNKIKKARFSISGLPGLLSKYQIVVE